MRSCPCGFVAAPGIAPDSAQWHRDHRQAHLTRYPHVDVGTRRNLDMLITLAEQHQLRAEQGWS